jgi:opacity protein-like surface antigen
VNNKNPNLVYEQNVTNGQLNLSRVEYGTYTMTVDYSDDITYTNRKFVVEENSKPEPISYNLSITSTNFVPPISSQRQSQISLYDGAQASGDYATVTINLSTNNNGSVSGSVIRLVNNNDTRIFYQRTASRGSIVFPDVRYGDYTLTVTQPSYEFYTDRYVPVNSPNIMTAVQLSTLPFVPIELDAPPPLPTAGTPIAITPTTPQIPSTPPVVTPPPQTQYQTPPAYQQPKKQSGEKSTQIYIAPEVRFGGAWGIGNSLGLVFYDDAKDITNRFEIQIYAGQINDSDYHFVNPWLLNYYRDYRNNRLIRPFVVAGLGWGIYDYEKKVWHPSTGPYTPNGYYTEEGVYDNVGFAYHLGGGVSFQFNKIIALETGLDFSGIDGYPMLTIPIKLRLVFPGDVSKTIKR